MKDSSHVEIIEDPVKEARRYVLNARDILKEKAELLTEPNQPKPQPHPKIPKSNLFAVQISLK